MDASKRIVNLFFAASTMITYVIMSKLFASVLATAGMRNAHILGKGFTMSNGLGALTAVVLLFWTWRHATIRPTIQEVGDELVKVTWPDWDETRGQSKVVIIVTLIISAILWLFDQVFGNLTDLILGG